MIAPLIIPLFTFVGVSQAPKLTFNFAPVWQSALHEADVKHDTIARLMGISSQQLSRQVDGSSRAHLSLFRLICIATDVDGRRFLRELIKQLGPHIGLEDRSIAEELDRIAAVLRSIHARTVAVVPDNSRRKESA